MFCHLENILLSKALEQSHILAKLIFLSHEESSIYIILMRKMAHIKG
jgi:hypothetical protein